MNRPNIGKGLVITLLIAGWGDVFMQRAMAQNFPPLPESSELFPELSPDRPAEIPLESSPKPSPEVLPESSPSSSPRLLPPPLPLPAQPFPSSMTTIFENVTLAPAFAPDPMTVRGISGGAMAANELMGRSETATGPCMGFIDQQPDHRMVLTQFFNYLNLQIQSSDNTTLVIRGPGGTWCNDDYAGKNPGIAGQWLSGTYEIWIGSYDQNTYHPYVIQMTEQE